MPRYTGKAKQMAKLFVHDPLLKGMWNECARKAGYDRVPSQDNKGLRYLIEKEGGMTLEGASELLQDLSPELEELVGSQKYWQEMAKKYAGVFQAVAAGTIKVTTTQWNALKYVFEKASTDESSHNISGLAILPVVDNGHGLPAICPVCRHKYEEMDHEDFVATKSGTTNPLSDGTGEGSVLRGVGGLGEDGRLTDQVPEVCGTPPAQGPAIT